MPLNQACLNRTYGPSTYVVTTEAVRAFGEATMSAPLAPATPGAEVALPTMAFVPCWPVIQEAIADPDLGNEPGQIIHGEQVMQFHRPLVAGDRLETTGTVASIEPKGRNEVYVLHLETRDARGALVVEQDNICISLGSAETKPESGAAPRPASPAATSHAAPSDPAWVAELTLPADITRRYSEASGDFSEVHLDDEFAQRLGFPGIIVQGMCVLSMAVRPALHELLDDDVRRLKGIRVRFASPVLPGETIRTEYVRDGAGCTFTTMGQDGRKVLGAGVIDLVSQ